MTMITSLDEEKVALLKNTICKTISQDDFSVFLHICKRTGLDPFSRQIYAIPRGNQMTIQTSIDGYRLIAERTGKYAPGREATYEVDPEGKLISATSFVKKMTADGSWHEVGATAYWSEYCQSFGGKPSQFWSKMPRLMLAKCAESLALRRAFPSELSGIYTEDEMKQADMELPSCEKTIEKISFDQYIELEEALKDFPGLKAKILSHEKATALEDISPDNYPMYLRRIEKERVCV